MEMGQGVRVLALVAHPDDEAWALSPLLVALMRGGADVVVCAATWGEAGADLRSAGAIQRDGRTLCAVRAQEFETCARRMGWRTGPGGGFADGGLERVDAADWARWFSGLRQQVAPSWWLTMAPDGGYGHRDHIALTEALVVWAGGQVPVQRVWGWCAPEEQGLWMRSLVMRVAPSVVKAGVEPGVCCARAAAMMEVEDARWIVERSLECHVSQLPGGRPGRFFGAGFWRGVRGEQRLMWLAGDDAGGPGGQR